MRLRIFILGSVLALQAPAFAKDVPPPQKLSDYVLDSAAYFELTLEQKIVYMKFVMKMMTTVEDLHASLMPNPAADCGGGLSSCGDSLSSMVPTLGKICIPQKETEHRTARCADRISELAGPHLNGHLETKALSYRDPVEAEKYAEHATQLKTTLDTAQNQIIGKSGLGEYCSATNASSEQAEKCARFQDLNEQFKIATAPPLLASADNVKRGPASDQLLAIPDEDPPAARAPAPRTHAAPERMAVATPAPRPRTQSSGRSGGSRQHPQLGALSCVARGLENVAGAEVKKNGVDNWLSLLGVSAQAFYGPYNTADGGNKRALQQRVIEMVSSFGYCTDDQYNIDPGAGESRDWIDGTRAAPHQRGGILKGLFPPQADEVKFASTYQVTSPNSKRMSFAAELFDDSSRWTGWDQGNVQQRQWRFRSKLAAHASTYKGSAFGRCAAQIEDKLAHSSNFKMCPITKARYSKGTKEHNVYPTFISGAEMAGNDRIYSAMASACGLPTTRKMPTRQCDSVCWGSHVYPSRNAQLRNCDPDGVTSYGQAMREIANNRRNGGGKGGEPVSYRRSPYGASHDGSFVNSSEASGGGNGPHGPSNTGHASSPAAGGGAPSGGGGGGAPSGGGGSPSGGGDSGGGKGAEGGNSAR